MKRKVRRGAQWVVPVPADMRWLEAPVRRAAKERFGGNIAALVREAVCRLIGESNSEVKRKHEAWLETHGE